MRNKAPLIQPVLVSFRGVATTRLLEAADRQGVRRCVYFSTAHIYSSPLVGRITEETRPTSSHPYACSHRAGEEAMESVPQRGEMERIVFRVSNALGAPVHPDVDCWMLLTNELCRQAVTTGRMVVRSSGLQRRDFVPLTDVCRAVDHVLQLAERGEGIAVLNLGGEWSPTVWEIASLLQSRCAAVLGFEPELTRLPPEADETPIRLDYRNDALRRTGL